MPEDTLPDLVRPIPDQDHFLGAWDARHTLIEYGDFECEHCGHLQPIVQELLRELGDELCFVFRHFPQPSIHPHAQEAAEAAEAAGMQAKFWLMHDRLYQHQTDLSTKEIRRIAEGLPIDLHHFDRDLASGAPARQVAEDVESGEENAVGATPSLFVNGKLHVGSYEFLPLLKALRAGRR
jgi:protein-disulfide isomerase